MTRAVTSGITEESIETMTEALLRMKATLTQESHAARRGADAPGLRGADAPGLRGAEAPGLRGAEAPGLRGAEARSTEAPDIVTREAV
jgi:hypothetical protein